MSSMIRLMCPNLKCRKILTVPGSTRGKTVRCRNCATRITVPEHIPAPAAPTAAEAEQTAPEGTTTAD